MIHKILPPVGRGWKRSNWKLRLNLSAPDPPRSNHPFGGIKMTLPSMAAWGRINGYLFVGSSSPIPPCNITFSSYRKKQKIGGSNALLRGYIPPPYGWGMCPQGIAPSASIAG